MSIDWINYLGAMWRQRQKVKIKISSRLRQRMSNEFVAEQVQIIQKRLEKVVRTHSGRPELDVRRAVEEVLPELDKSDAAEIARDISMGKKVTIKLKHLKVRWSPE